MKRLHIVGRKNHGKTTLLVELVGELRRAGLRIGTIKHTSHVHELDKPGSDSCRHRLAGADPAAVVSGRAIAVHLPCEGGDYLRQLAPMFAGCDLVLIEGHLDGEGHKIEVWRAQMGDDCLASQRRDIAAVVTDDPAPDGVPVLPRSNLEPLVDYVLGFVGHQRQEVPS
ncbi:MAG: molybdopterin-guanine dinucleotide biosynthesis protein B [Pirellulales bacterium]|nr:molybdopterin-guanine dinucleotide biosynthesis protein B [Pirellulales bacterium]